MESGRLRTKIQNSGRFHLRRAKSKTTAAARWVRRLIRRLALISRSNTSSVPANTFAVSTTLLRIVEIWTLNGSTRFANLRGCCACYRRDTVTSPDQLVRLPAIQINGAAWVTFLPSWRSPAVVAAAARRSLQHYRMTSPNKWNPASLPPLEKNVAPGCKSRSFTQAVAEVVIGFLLMRKRCAIPAHPVLLMGPGAVILRVAPYELAPVWWTNYWPIIGLNALQVASKTFDLACVMAAACTHTTDRLR